MAKKILEKSAEISAQPEAGVELKNRGQPKKASDH